MLLLNWNFSWSFNYKGFGVFGDEEKIFDYKSFISYHKIEKI